MFGICQLLVSLCLLLFGPVVNAQVFPLSKILDSAYLITLSPEDSSQAPVGRLHNWVVAVEDVSGSPVQLVPLSVSGGMREHGHGFYTAPQFSAHLGGGRFRLSGVLFNMPGRWQMALRFQGPDKRPLELEFELDVLPRAATAPLAAAGAEQKAALTGAFKANNWSAKERLLMQSLLLDDSPPPPVSSNKRADDERVAVLGHRLFFDTALSSSADMACASCHQPGRYYSDNLEAPAESISGRNVPSLMGIAANRFFNWDGAHDSLWSQALGPIESPVEMNMPRIALVTAVGRLYRDEYAQLFAVLPAQEDLQALPQHASPQGGAAAVEAWQGLSPATQVMVNRHFSNIGKALAAYQRRLRHQKSRFDRYVSTLERNGEELAAQLMSESEREGLRLFLSDEVQCMRCHNGANFSNGEFHNADTGTAEDGSVDAGRQTGLVNVLDSAFNCRGEFSDNPGNSCPDLSYLVKNSLPMLRGAFKVPSLRNVEMTGPYMHDGRFETLAQVLQHYRDPDVDALGQRQHELQALQLNDRAIQQLADFLGSLTGELKRDRWFKAPQKRR